eukprot:scaffold63755_cov22-Tisochrysis_lutea.AAC.3
MWGRRFPPSLPPSLRHSGHSSGEATRGARSIQTVGYHHIAHAGLVRLGAMRWIPRIAMSGSGIDGRPRLASAVCSSALDIPPRLDGLQRVGAL